MITNITFHKYPIKTNKNRKNAELKIIYSESLYKNKLLYEDKKTYKNSVYISQFVGFFLIIIMIMMIMGILPERKTYIIGLNIPIIMLFLLSLVPLNKYKKINPLEVYEEGFTWPYYNWPTKNGFVYWEDVKKIILNVKEVPDYIFIGLNINNKKDFYPLKKYAIYNIERFLDMAREKGIEVVEDEISYRELQKLRKTL